MAARAGIFGLAPSGDSRGRSRRPRAPLPEAAQETRAKPARERGLALILALTSIAILAVVLADMHENTASSFALATTQRDRLKAEYIAKSGLNLTRLLISQRRVITQAVTPIYQAMSGRPPGNLSVWTFANEVLAPFCDLEGSAEAGQSAGFSLESADGLGDTGGTCEIIAFSENSRINVNQPLFRNGNEARNGVAMQFYGLIGGYQQPSPYDALFDRPDADGLRTTQLQVVSALIDWWDPDTERTQFDPGALTVRSSGAEDDPYGRFDDSYDIKNAPFDSLEELRLIRGVGDDFWATFVEPDEDPRSRAITVYGSGRINPNEADPRVLLAQTCAVIPETTLCSTPAEAAKFIQLLLTVRQLAPIPWFLSVDMYVQFLRGEGGATDLYPLLTAMLGGNPELLFTPVALNTAQAGRFHEILVFDAQIIYVESIGRVGNGCVDPTQGRCTRVRLRSVLNFHSGRQGWTPPPPNPGTMPRLGVFHHYRID